MLATAPIYLLGGVDQNFNTTATLWRYDPISNTYNTSLPSYTIPTYFHASAYLNGKIYRIAGAAIGTDFHVEVYDIAANTWSMAANYPFANHNLMAVALGGYIYGAGGNASPDKTYRYDPNTDTWGDAAITDLPANRSSAASGAYNGRWILAGGDVNFAASNSVIVWEPATNTWSELPNMIQARDNLEGATAGQSFYAVAGDFAPGSPTNDNQEYTETPCGTPTPPPTPTPSIEDTPTPTPTTPPCEYSTITGTGSIVPGTTDIGNHCDNCSTLITLPFPVSLYMLPITEILVTSNGSLSVSDDHGYFGTSCPLPDPNLGLAVLAYQDDLRTDGPNDGIFTLLTGTAPNRVFNIEWRTTYSGRNGTANFEVRFYENQNFFDIIYGATADNGALEESGIQPSPFFGTTFSCHTPTLTNGLKITYSCGQPFTPTPTATPTATLPPPTPTPTASPALRPTPSPRSRPTPAPRP